MGNPYEAPRAAAEAEADPAGAIAGEELLAFAGKGGEYYWWLWKHAQGRNRLLMGWNWWAALGNGLWLAYRRMWREYVVFFVGTILWEYLLYGVSVLLKRDVQLGTLGNVALYVVGMGLLGNGLYLRRARLEVAEARRAYPGDQMRQRAQLRQVGGTSWWWALAALGVSIAWYWVATALAPIIGGLFT